jgi:urease accessory protein
MGWHARLDLDYLKDGARTLANHAHEGPLRILQTLYPEGEAIAHNVLVHPPSGLVGGDTLDIAVRVASASHGLITTPGAARFYRSEAEPAVQRTRISLASGGRLEWLPQETLCYSGCIAENHLFVDLAPCAEIMGWDITALGLPASELPFTRGSLLQQLEVKGSWLERGRIAADDERLLDGPLGLAAHRCFATLFFATHEPIGRSRREEALALANAVIAQHGDGIAAGATAPAPNVIVVRALAAMVEPAMSLLKAVRAAWRPALWDLPANAPRVWSV